MSTHKSKRTESYADRASAFFGPELVQVCGGKNATPATVSAELQRRDILDNLRMIAFQHERFAGPFTDEDIVFDK